MVLNDCTICNVYGDDNKIRSRIRVKCANNTITLYFKKSNELADSENVRIDFFDAHIGYIQTFCAVNVQKNYNPAILEPYKAHCEILQVVQIVQRQIDLRVHLEKEITFMSRRHGSFTGIIQNISSGGLYLATTTRLEADEEFEFSYRFAKKPHDVKALVLRRQELKKGYYGYGCQFLSLTNSAEKDIRQFVYRQQQNYAW